MVPAPNAMVRAQFVFEQDRPICVLSVSMYSVNALHDSISFSLLCTIYISKRNYLCLKNAANGIILSDTVFSLLQVYCVVF